MNMLLFLVIFVLGSGDCDAFAIRSVDPTISGSAHTLEKPQNLKMDDENAVYSKKTHVAMPIYSLYLIGLMMILMIIALVCLALVIYLIVKKNKTFEINTNNKQYLRQESTGVATLHNSNYDDQNQIDGSTLTVNSGIIEISRISDPVATTRIEDSKIIFTRKPTNPIVPIIQRVQMEKICKEVLMKVQKTDSASYRDLNELLNGQNERKYVTVHELENENENKENIATNQTPIEENKLEAKLVLKPETNIEPNLDTDYLYNYKQEKIHEIKDELNHTDELKEETEKPYSHEAIYDITNEPIYDVMPETKNIRENADSNVNIQIKNVEDKVSTKDSDSEETEYDTVPGPVRCNQSNDDIVESCDFYDLPPRRSYELQPRNVIDIDQDSQYLFPLTPNKSDSCYINAKNCDKR